MTDGLLSLTEICLDTSIMSNLEKRNEQLEDVKRKRDGDGNTL